jgi:ABC-2 type transport system ATP-binding protein
MIGVAPQELALYPMLTGAENLRFFRRIYDISGLELASRVGQLLDFVGLQDRGNDRVATYSGGMKRRLNLAVALVHRPKLILLDEPTAGVDPQSRDDILRLVRRLRDEGNAILYTTHYLEEAEGLCDRLCFLNQGEVVAVGTLDALLRHLEFSEVIELKGLSPRADLAALRALGGVCRVECADGLVRLFVKRAADLLGPLQRLTSRDKVVRLKIAPLRLENLFLHLTGGSFACDPQTAPDGARGLASVGRSCSDIDSARLQQALGTHRLETTHTIFQDSATYGSGGRDLDRSATRTCVRSLNAETKVF